MSGAKPAPASGDWDPGRPKESIRDRAAPGGKKSSLDGVRWSRRPEAVSALGNPNPSRLARLDQGTCSANLRTLHSFQLRAISVGELVEETGACCPCDVPEFRRLVGWSRPEVDGSESLMTLLEHIQETRNCRGPEVHRELLLLGVPPIWRAVLRLFPKVLASNSWFVEERLVQECLCARTQDQVSAAVERFHYRGLSQVPFLRRGLRLRVSGRRLLRLASKVLPRSVDADRLPGPLLGSGWGGSLAVRDQGHQQEATVLHGIQNHRSARPSDAVYQPFVVPPQRIEARQ